MPNANYQRGVRFERALVTALKACGAEAARTAGSHGRYDVVAVASDMATACAVNRLFEWLSVTQPKDPWFDWVCRFGGGRLDKLCYAKVVNNGQGEWAYFLQCKVSQ